MRIRYTRISTIDIKVTEKMLGDMTPEQMARANVNNDNCDEMFDGKELTEEFLYEIFDDNGSVIARGKSDN